MFSSQWFTCCQYSVSTFNGFNSILEAFSAVPGKTHTVQAPSIGSGFNQQPGQVITRSCPGYIGQFSSFTDLQKCKKILLFRVLNVTCK